MVDYIFASKKNYISNQLFEKLKKKYNIEFVCEKCKLEETILRTNPTKIFFFHWSYIVPKNIYNKYECINIHTSNLPNGRGGSPLQNQIIDNIITTRVNSLKMTDKGIDAGPIYCYKEISLQGSIFDIWLTLGNVSYDLICKIIDENLIPIEQENNCLKKYNRRKNNIIPFDKQDDLLKIYDFIRMLDFEDYPSPYIKMGIYKLEFNRANFNGEEIIADVKITKSL